MTSLLRTFIALLCAAGFASPRPAPAQEARAQAESKRLAVEVVVEGDDHPSRFKVYGPASYDAFAEFTAPPNLQGGRQSQGGPPLTRIRLRTSYEGDAVRIKVAAVFEDTHMADAPGPKYGAREEPVESLLAREGETLSVKGFERFGAQPLVLRVVRFEPEPERPPTPAPARVVNNLKSVEVISFAVAGAQLERGLLTLLNVSSKNIVALEVSVPDSGVSQHAQGAPGRAIMRPGGTYRTEITLGSSWSRDGVPEPRPDALVVTAVVFDDGAYEGEMERAMWMAARQKGRLTQFARVLALVQSALDAQGQDVAATFDDLKAKVAGLRIDAEPPLLDELLAQFPKLSGEEGRKLVAGAALDGLRAGREESLRVIRQAAETGPSRRRQLEEAREQIGNRAGVRRD